MRRAIRIGGMWLALGLVPCAESAAQEAGAPQPVQEDTAVTYRRTFIARPDGGRMEIRCDDPADTATITFLRRHMRSLALMFSRGDFSTPEYILKTTIPGTDVLYERRKKVRYTPENLPDGAAITIRTRDRQALEAVHRFLEFQAEAERRKRGS